MNNKGTYAVAMIGIPEYERLVLRSIIKLSKYRSPAYVFSNMTPSEPADILIVDADDANAMTTWRTFYQTDENIVTIPTVMLTKSTELNSPFCVRRPLIVRRVFNALDELVGKEFGAHDKRTIGDCINPVPVQRQPPSPVHQQTSSPVHRQTPNSTLGHQSYTALVVDDSLAVRKQIELELHLSGIQVDCAESGERAFELLAGSLYDLVFLDVVLPGVDGYQICKTIKKDKDKKQMPVIMLTSKSSPFDRVRGKLAGCDSYLTKPVKQHSFQGVVKKYLQQEKANVIHENLVLSTAN